MSKKSFKDNINPAMQFISKETPKEDKKPLLDNKDITPKGYKPNPAYIETKSQRVQLLVQPSIVEAIKQLAKDNNSSMNAVINEAIKEYLEKNSRV